MLRWLRWFKSFFLEDKDPLSCMVNTMAAADRATQGPRASVAMVMDLLPWNILVSAPGSLMIVCRTWGCHLFTVYNFWMICEMTSILWLMSREIYLYDGFLANWLNICLYCPHGGDFIGLSNDKLSRLEAEVFTRVQFWPSGFVIAHVCVSDSVCINHLFVRMITHQPFKLESPNLKHRCKTLWLKSLLFQGVIDLDLQGKI